MFQYFRRWLRLAFTGNLGVAERLEFLALAVLGIGGKILFGDSDMTVALMAGIPAAILVGTIAVGLILAPYWMYQEQTRKTIDTESERDRLQALLAAEEQNLARKLELNSFIENGAHVVRTLRIGRGEGISDDVINTWVNMVHAWIREHFPEFAGQFLNEGGFGIQGSQEGPMRRANLVNYMDRRLARLGELLNRL